MDETVSTNEIGRVCHQPLIACRVFPNARICVRGFGDIAWYPESAQGSARLLGLRVQGPWSECGWTFVSQRGKACSEEPTSNFHAITFDTHNLQ